MKYKVKKIQLFQNPFFDSLLTKVFPPFPLIFWLPIPVFLIYQSAVQKTFSAWEMMGLIAGGVIIWTLIEYGLHRFVFHINSSSKRIKDFIYLIHGNHHDEPRDPLRGLMPIIPGYFYGALIFLTLNLFFNYQMSALLMSGVIFGYLIYDYLHYSFHHMNINLKWWKKLRHYHQVHHTKDYIYYGVSCPYWDVVFGTHKLKTKTQDQFIHTDSPEPHKIRRAQMSQKHGPKIKKLFGANTLSKYIILALVGLSFSMAYFIAQTENWWLLIGSAYLVGAFLHHALYVFIHEASHNLVAKNKILNKVFGVICDFPLVFPGAMAFRKFHLVHHKHMGLEEADADICSSQEAKLVGRSRILKIVWMLFFGVSQALRPLKLKDGKLDDPWIFVNLILVMAINFGVFFLWGPMALIYLFLSTFFGLGLHPLGARWIAEHYTMDAKQETFSYYGPINKIMFNIGYHTEHHDFMNIPWNHLPKLKKIAPEFYVQRKYHPSYTKLLIEFIMNRKMSGFSRVVREK
jgi:sphingolipid delta-4 desaturase